MSKTIGILEASGWVERVADTHDRRKADLHLTDSGVAVVHHMEERMVALLASLFEPLSTAEIERLMDGMGVLHEVARSQLRPSEAAEESQA
jgi:DNA-binding MarR family transcriptional regulator